VADPLVSYSVEIDLRGETLTYVEGDRRATVICGFGGDPTIAPRTLSAWWYPQERREMAMTEAEAEAVMARIVSYCRGRHGMRNLRIEDEDYS
jgi:hypothetical protein